MPQAKPQSENRDDDDEDIIADSKLRSQEIEDRQMPLPESEFPPWKS